MVLTSRSDSTTKPPSLFSLLPSHQKDELVSFIYEDIELESLLEVYFEFLHDFKLLNSVCNRCNKKCYAFLSKTTNPNLDCFGNDPSIISQTDKYECPQCNVGFPAARFAPHLEKCLGMGRQSRSVRSSNNNNKSIF
ncbi:hypothetical protein BC833DRAFT_6311 [Globomyces pollinis-pini]|nr:hypothetical protein BC833DRAFT_6311 [Globomyces pollinis-pini]